MTDIAQLGFAVDTTGLAKGEVALKKLAGASAIAERASTGVTVANDNVSAASDRAAASYMRLGNAAKMASFQQRNLVFQLNDVFVSLASGMNPLMVAAQQGSQIATIYGPGEGGIGRAFKETGKMVAGVLTRFPLVTAAVAGISAAFGALTYEINRTSDVQVSFGDVALGIFQTVRDGIWGFIKPAVDAIAPWFAAAYELVKTYTVDGVNFIINAFTGGFGVIRDLWRQLPAVIGDLTAQAAQASIDAFNSAIQYVTGAGPAPEAGRFRVPNANAGAASRAFSDASGIMSDAFSQNPLGSFFSSVGSNAMANARARQEPAKGGSEPAKARELANAWRDVGGATKAANDNLREAQSIANGFVSDLRNGLKQGESLWQSFGNAAQRALDGIIDKALQMATNQIVAGLFGGGAAISPSLFNASGGLRFGGPRANGGPVSRGNAYLVGERGPELFVPGASGGIIANQNGGANVQVINNYAGNASVSTEGSGSAGDPLRIVIDAVKNDMAKNGIGAGAEGRYGLRRQTRAR
jgi:hypothetical protein